jgi:hypothetical protein
MFCNVLRAPGLLPSTTQIEENWMKSLVVSTVQVFAVCELEARAGEAQLFTSGLFVTKSFLCVRELFLATGPLQPVAQAVFHLLHKVTPPIYIPRSSTYPTLPVSCDCVREWAE